MGKSKFSYKKVIVIKLNRFEVVSGEQSGISGAKRPESGGIILEEAAKVIGGVAGELVFFMRSFLLGFLMRLGYEPIIFFRRVFRQPKLLLSTQILSIFL